MIKWLFAFLWVAAWTAGADVAAAQDNWARINSATASANARQVIIDTSDWQDGCKGIRIAVTNATIAIEGISLVYATGRVHAENFETPVRVGPGAQSRVFAPTSEARKINLVTIRFTRVDRSASAATIEVWGLRPTSATSERSVQRRQFKIEGPGSSDPQGGSAPRSRSIEVQPPPPPTTPQQSQPRSLQRSAPPPVATGPSPTETAPSAPTPRSRGLQSEDAARPPASQPSPGAPSTNPAQVADKPYSEIDVFFGTDRKREADRSKFGRPLATFGTVSSKQLVLGKAVVTVPKEGREVGSIPRPEWDLLVTRFSFREENPARDFTLHAVDILSRDDFIRQARTKVQSSRKFRGQAFIFVHGYFVTFEDAMFRAAQISHDLEFDGVPFVYSWPSVAGLTGYVLDRGRARDARDLLRQFVDTVAKESGATEVHLIAHSMGADPLLEVLRDISNSEPRSTRSKPRFGEIILAAPDVTRESFETISSQITGLRRGMTLYASSNDRALAASRFTRLGESPAGYVPTGGPIVVPGAADTIDVSNLDTSFFGVNHSTFADRRPLLHDMQRLISDGIRPPSSRDMDFTLIQGTSGAYWRFEKPRTP